MKKLFTERHGMAHPRVKEELDAELTRGLLTVVNAEIQENLFGETFSLECPDNASNSYGRDLDKLKSGLAAYNVIWPPGWPKSDDKWPSKDQQFDLLEFLYEHARLPHFP